MVDNLVNFNSPAVAPVSSLSFARDVLYPSQAVNIDVTLLVDFALPKLSSLLFTFPLSQMSLSSSAVEVYLYVNDIL